MNVNTSIARMKSKWGKETHMDNNLNNKAYDKNWYKRRSVEDKNCQMKNPV